MVPLIKNAPQGHTRDNLDQGGSNLDQGGNNLGIVSTEDETTAQGTTSANDQAQSNDLGCMALCLNFCIILGVYTFYFLCRHLLLRYPEEQSSIVVIVMIPVMVCVMCVTDTEDGTGVKTRELEQGGNYLGIVSTEDETTAQGTASANDQAQSNDLGCMDIFLILCIILAVCRCCFLCLHLLLLFPDEQSPIVVIVMILVMVCWVCVTDTEDGTGLTILDRCTRSLARRGFRL
jgi:hypothetical protein